MTVAKYQVWLLFEHTSVKIVPILIKYSSNMQWLFVYLSWLFMFVTVDLTPNQRKYYLNVLCLLKLIFVITVYGKIYSILFLVLDLIHKVYIKILNKFVIFEQWNEYEIQSTIFFLLFLYYLYIFHCLMWFTKRYSRKQMCVFFSIYQL